MPKKTMELKVFEQHGFIQSGESGNQVLGICPFCGGDRFFINPENKMWDCKHCSSDGGYKTFLKKINKLCQENLIGQVLGKLSKNRGISKNTLKSLGVGYNTRTDRYTFPILSVDKSEIWNIYMYDLHARNKLFIGSSGALQGLLGWENLNQKDDTIWLCEGHWDYAVMIEMIEKTGIRNVKAIGVPGVSVFKDEWAMFFKNKNVIVVYDNDHDKERNGKAINPAKEGSLKVYNKLIKLARSLKFVNWPDNLKDGYDLRDCYKDNLFDAEETFLFLTDVLTDYPKGVNLPDTKKKQPVTSMSGEGVIIDNVYKIYQKYLHLEDLSIIDIFYGSVLANRLEGDPVWLFLVGSSGGGKTELIHSIRDCNEVYTADEITQHTLISGSIGPGGSDPSLIPQLDGKVLVIKDFTTILEMDKRARDAIFGQLRAAYDGDYSKPFGVGTVRSYDSKFGIIAGVTRSIEMFMENQTALGERFLRCVLPSPKSDTRLKIIRKALNNTRKNIVSPMRQEFRDAGVNILNYDFPPVHDFENDSLMEKLIYLAEWVATARGSVIRDTYTKEVLHKPMKEVATRIVIQLSKLLSGIAMLHRRDCITEYDFNIVKKKVASGSISSRYDLILRAFHKSNYSILSTKEIIEYMRLPAVTVKRQLEDLHLLGITKKESKDNLGNINWRITNRFYNLTKETAIYE